MSSRIATLVAFATVLISTTTYGEGLTEKKNTVMNKSSQVAPVNGGLTKEMLYEFLLGEIALQRGESRIATQAYKKLTNLTSDPRVAQRSVEIAINSNDLQAAADATEVWFKLEPESASAQQTHMALLLATGKIEQATPIIKQVLRSQPTFTGRTFMQINSLIARYPDKPAALEAVSELTADYPKSSEAHYIHAQAAKAVQQN